MALTTYTHSTYMMHWAERLLGWFCKDEHLEILLGDLYELYEHRKVEKGERIARWMFIIGVLDLFRPFAWKRFSQPRLFYHLDMLKHYFKIGWRSLWRHKGFSSIKVFGLAIGLASCLLMLLYVQHELSYDQFHEDRDHIARVWMHFNTPERNVQVEVTPNIIGPLIRRSFPDEVEASVRIQAGAPVVRRGKALFREEGFIYADSTFFEIFSFDLKKGDPAQVLTEKHSLVLTESAARQYFGAEDPMGQTLALGSNETPYLITGIMADPPANSHLQFTMVGPFHSLRFAMREEIFSSANYLTYLKLAPETSMASLEAKLPDMVLEHGGEDVANLQAFFLQPLADVYLGSSEIENYLGCIKKGDRGYIYLFSSLAMLILLIAAINYVNLTTARSVDRAREVGLRKVIGAKRRQLIQQFMGETVLITLISLIISLFVVQFALPYFESLIGKNLNIQNLLTWDALLVLLAGGAILGLLAGLYPSLLLSQYRPVAVLRGKFKNSSGGLRLRQGLVVFQFAISVILIAGALIVHQQLNFLSEKKLGYERERVVYAFAGWGADSSINVLRQVLLSDPAVEAVATATNPPHSIQGGYSISRPAESESEGRLITAMMIDEHFLDAMEMELIAGRNFTPQQTVGEPADEQYAFILNEQAVSYLGLAMENAIGERYNLNGRVGRIQGIIKDFHFASLHEPIGPLVLFTGDSRPQVMIRLAAGPTQTQLGRVKEIWETHLPGRPFDYQFLDQAYAAVYEDEQKVGDFALTFAVLGLLGLAAYTIVQRTKEIGIRKVLGAETSEIVMLLSREFTWLVAIALGLGLPAAYLLMSNWLENFAYRTPMGILIFVLTAALALVIAWATVGWLAFRAANTNPSESLKVE